MRLKLACRKNNYRGGNGGDGAKLVRLRRFVNGIDDAWLFSIGVGGTGAVTWLLDVELSSGLLMFSIGGTGAWM